MRKRNYLGIAYNAFDSLELLVPSIRSVRNVAEYVCVVYQTKSNFHEPMSNIDQELLERARKSCLVDEFILYNPVHKGGHANELAKRNLGKDACLNAGCSYFMTMDVDEFYLEPELRFALNSITKSGHDASACKMQTYYKSAGYVIDPPEEYYVPLIYRMDARKFDLRNRWPVAADPTRRLASQSVRLFDRTEVQMHHMSYVRRDLGMKLRNSSARANFHSRIDRIVDHFNRWQPGQSALLAGKEERLYRVIETQELFSI